MITISRYAKKLFEAAQEYAYRKNRTSDPVGTFDSAGRWYPSRTKERCSCCDYIRSPSRAYPYSYMTHCRSADHVAHLFRVDERELKALALAIAQHEGGETMRVEKRLGKAGYKRFLSAYKRNTKPRFALSVAA